MKVSEKDTESLVLTGLPENRNSWSNRQWGIYSLRCLMYHVDIMNEDDVQQLQEILIDLEGRAKNGTAK